MPWRRLRIGLVLLAVAALGACASVSSDPPPPARTGAPPALETRGLYRVACAATPVFAEPSDRAPRLETLDAGGLIAAQDDGSAWALVRRRGSDGFVDWRCLVPPEDFDPAETVEIAAATAPPPAFVAPAPEPAFAPVERLAPSFVAPRSSGFVFDAPPIMAAPAFNPETAPFDPSLGYNPLDDRPEATPPPSIASVAPPVSRFAAAPAAVSPRPRGPQVAAANGPSFIAAAPRPATIDPPNAPGLRPPPPDEQFGVMGTRPPVQPFRARSLNRRAIAALPPAAPSPGDARPMTRFGPPPRYRAILRDESGSAPALVARAPPRVRQSGGYAVQIGSYRVPGNAARAVARAQSMGFSPEILRAGALHRIRLTGFGDYAAAAAERARYLAAGGAEAYVVRM